MPFVNVAVAGRFEYFGWFWICACLFAFILSMLSSFRSDSHYFMLFALFVHIFNAYFSGWREKISYLVVGGGGKKGGVIIFGIFVGFFILFFPPFELLFPPCEIFPCRRGMKNRCGIWGSKTTGKSLLGAFAGGFFAPRGLQGGRGEVAGRGFGAPGLLGAASRAR